MSGQTAKPEEEHAEKQGAFGSRLMAAMADMENPVKSKTANVPTKSGKSYQYKYETLEQVLGVVRPALAEHGLAMTQQQAWSGNTNSYVLRTIVFDGSEERVMDERPLRDAADAQVAGSWETYMRRYALRTAFGLAGEDDDGNATTGRDRQANRPAASQAKRQADPDAVRTAWNRLLAACASYEKKNGMEPREAVDGVKGRADYPSREAPDADKAEWFRAVAEEFEAEL